MTDKKPWCPAHGYPLPCYKCGMPLDEIHPQREMLTDNIYNSLKEIQEEEGIRFNNKAFIADRLAPKLSKLGYHKLDEEELAKGLAEILGNVKWSNIRDGSRNYWRKVARQILSLFPLEG